MQATDSLGSSAETPASLYTYIGLSNYQPLSPFRILDTRSGSCVQCTGGALGPGAIRKLQITGVLGDRVPTGTTAVVLNVTAVADTASSLLTVFPDGTTRPNASNLNFAAGAVIPNLVTVTLGTDGAVDIYNALGKVNVIADVEGFFQPELSSVMAGEFHPIAPIRMCDTRTACRGNVALRAERPIVVNVTGTGGIPSNGSAEAAVLNLTGVAGTAATYLSVFPTNASGGCTYTGTHAPPFSTLNLLAGAVEANRVMVQLGPASPGGNATSVCVYNAAGTINVILDANGWYGSDTGGTGSQYQAIAPSRVCDTRYGAPACTKATIGPAVKRLIGVAGDAGVPAYGGGTNVVAVIANLTAVAPTQRTFLTLYPANLTSSAERFGCQRECRRGPAQPCGGGTRHGGQRRQRRQGLHLQQRRHRQRDHRHRGLVPVAAASFASRTEWRCGVGRRRPARPVGRRIPWGTDHPGTAEAATMGGACRVRRTCTTAPAA